MGRNRIAPALIVGMLVFAGPVHAGPLHDATKKGDLSAAQMALSSGAKVNSADRDGKTALFYAVAGNKLDIAALLLKRGANPSLQNRNSYGPDDAPLHIAAKQGNLKAIEMLAKAGADLHVSTANTPSPLHLAIISNQPGAATLLRKFGAGVYKAPSVNALLSKMDLKIGANLTRGACGPCHALTKTGKPSDGSAKPGPPLWNIMGSRIGKKAGFKYTAAMKAATGAWTYEAINSFLANPTAYMPGTEMWKALRNKRLRALVIAYIRTLADKPLPLP